jgi:ribosomal-protein-alanine N-acetyltransferase
METRLAAKDDAPVLAALHGEIFGEARWSLAQISNSLALDTTQALLVCEGEKPQGFILCQIVAEESEILTFCVAPLARRKGLGTLLLNEAAAMARQKKANRLFLEVAADNVAAITLYEKAGFRIVGTRAGYYKRTAGPIDAVMMSLRL